MDRAKLIRSHFESVRDLRWAETIEPNLANQGISAKAMEKYREQWNQHAEQKDWTWWQNQAKGYSDEEIDDMRMDSIEKLDGIGMRQHLRDREERERKTFQVILDEKPPAGEESLAPDKCRDEHSR